MQLFIDPGKLLPLNRFLPKPPAPKGPKKKGPPGGVGGGRGGFGGRGGAGGGFRGRGGNYPNSLPKIQLFSFVLILLLYFTLKLSILSAKSLLANNSLISFLINFYIILGIIFFITSLSQLTVYFTTLLNTHKTVQHL